MPDLVGVQPFGSLLTIAIPDSESALLPGARFVSVDEEGFSYRSAHDGRLVRTTPESAIAAAEQLGVDLLTVPDCEVDWMAAANAERQTGRLVFWSGTDEVHRRRMRDWTSRAFVARRSGRPILRTSPHVRPSDSRRSAGAWNVLTNRKLSVHGQSASAGELSPRNEAYLLSRGVDLIIADGPLTQARAGNAVDPRTLDHRWPLWKTPGSIEPGPISSECRCPACQYSASYIEHLLRVNEPLGTTLLTIHNLTALTGYARDLRQAILEKRTAEVVFRE